MVQEMVLVITPGVVCKSLITRDEVIPLHRKTERDLNVVSYFSLPLHQNDHIISDRHIPDTFSRCH
jgi:hypothetical protein